MNEQHPCDLCDRKMDCSDCALGGYSKEYQCNNYDCEFLHEDSCLLGFYERCGAWKK